MKTKEQIFEFIGKQKTTLMASVDEDGFPNLKASIYFYQRGRLRYEGIMLIGTMEVLQDEEIKKEIWRTGDNIFYKEGVTDPDYCVLKFTAVKGRHYCDLKTENFLMKDLA